MLMKRAKIHAIVQCDTRWRRSELQCLGVSRPNVRCFHCALMQTSFKGALNWCFPGKYIYKIFINGFKEAVVLTLRNALRIALRTLRNALRIAFAHSAMRYALRYAHKLTSLRIIVTHTSMRYASTRYATSYAQNLCVTRCVTRYVDKCA